MTQIEENNKHFPLQFVASRALIGRFSTYIIKVNYYAQIMGGVILGAGGFIKASELNEQRKYYRNALYQDLI